MNARLQPVRGTHDLLPDDCRHYRAIVDTARRVAETYGFAEIMTPMFEFSEVFHRTLGETSDVVSKETYTFEDRGGESLTLRPELTAGIARAFISNGLQDQTPCKYFCAGPAFRYERPQKGRQRQFHQIDVELIGEWSYRADVEIIACGWQILQALGVGSEVTLELNSLGDAKSRAAYRTALIEYLYGHADALSEDSKIRLEKNPMRILDSKNEGDRIIVAGAPKMQDHYTDEAQQFFGYVCEGLDALGIIYMLNPKLVRGLDYYTHSVFEFTTTALGAQGTVLGGGRYDGLIAHMGGLPTPGIGFAAGIERLMALQGMGPPPTRKSIALIPLNEATESEALKLAFRLRQAGFIIEHLSYSGNISKRFKKADKLGAVVALILGEDEIAHAEIMLKDLKTGEQKSIPLSTLETTLKSFARNQ